MAQVGLQNEPLSEQALFGFYSGAFSRLPLLFGVSGIVQEIVQNTSLTAGTNVLAGAAVPAGFIYVITNVSMRYDGTITNVSLQASRKISGTRYPIFEKKTPVTAEAVDRQGWWVLLPGNSMDMMILGATLNDDAYFNYSGFSIEIA